MLTFFFPLLKNCRMREDMSTMVCVKEEEDPGEKLSQDEIISRTKQVIQGLEALKQEHHSILEGLLGTLRCLKQDEEGVLVEEKSHMIRKSLEMLELGLSEAQVRTYSSPQTGKLAGCGTDILILLIFYLVFNNE